MAGTNPYIEKIEAPPAKCRFKVTFKPCGTVFEVDPAKIPYDRTGLPGSILDIAEGAGVDIDHACGGVAACSTCHVVIDADWFAKLPPAIDDEEDMLDLAAGVTRTSRLSCQIELTEALDGLVVHIPAEARDMQGR